MRACATGPNTFDYVYNTGPTPNADRTQVMAAVTHLFYMINYLHDWYYDAGFDEASGNAQATNYGRGGLANDSIRSRTRRTTRRQQRQHDHAGRRPAAADADALPVDGRPSRSAKVKAPAAVAGV